MWKKTLFPKLLVSIDQIFESCECRQPYRYDHFNLLFRLDQCRVFDNIRSKN